LQINNPIIKNFFSLFLSQAFSKVFAFLSTIYLARILTPDGFGLYGFAIIFVSYFAVLINFGLDTFGTREIAKEQYSGKLLVNNILTFRIILAFVLYLALVLIVLGMNFSNTLTVVLIVAGLYLFPNAIQVSWAYYGFEKMGYVGIIQTISSLLNFIGVVLFVKSSGDLIYSILILSLSYVVSNILLIIKYVKKFSKISFSVDFNFWVTMFKESLPIGLSTIMISVYYGLDILMLGFFRTVNEVGYYNAAFKIFMLFIGIQSLVNYVIFPFISRNSNNNIIIEEFINGAMYLMNRVSVVVCFVLVFLANDVIKLFYGSDYSASVVLLQLLGISSFFVFNETITAPYLLASNKSKKHLIAVTAGAIINIILNIILIPGYGAIGACIATISSEIFVFSLLYYFSSEEINIYFTKIFLYSIIPITWTVYIFNQNTIIKLYLIITFIGILILSINKIKFLTLRLVGMK